MGSKTIVSKHYAKSPFVYDGKQYAAGDEWVPGGHRNDDAILRTLIRTENQIVEQPTRGRRKGAK
ncbi:MAG: hypothetical protein AMJ53_15255 [Gammaproteobacteria bacterium SG8_11]|nr:MAG: hypothetical protein AMJ53_15255 [Gammaproteobacteria bacterium SG8_11]